MRCVLLFFFYSSFTFFLVRMLWNGKLSRNIWNQSIFIIYLISYNLFLPKSCSFQKESYGIIQSKRLNFNFKSSKPWIENLKINLVKVWDYDLADIGFTDFWRKPIIVCLTLEDTNIVQYFYKQQNDIFVSFTIL